MADLINSFVGILWTWNVPLLVGAGIFFLIYSKLKPFMYLGHAFDLIRGKYSNADDVGDVTHFQALTTAMSGTIGLGNIAGVAIAINMGGPGTIFWMWLTAIVGIATKFFTCTAAVMYRDIDAQGHAHGGTMYVIKNALPKSMMPFAYFFAGAGLIGALPGFQSNQLVQILGDLEVFQFAGFNFIAGIVLAILTGVVVLGGLQRIAKVSEWLVPFMSCLYFGSVMVALILNFDQVIPAFQIIINDAFTGSAVAGGSVIAVIIIGVRRGAFSNEAGTGTESLVHGSAKTSHPVKQGLVAMLGPILDTLVMCTATALLIIISGVWTISDANGVTLTAEAFSMLLGPAGYVVLFICVISFGISTILTYSHYGAACARFLMGERGARLYQWIYILFVVVFAVVSIDVAVNIIDGAFALMAIPTLISTIWIAPKVVAKAQEYFEMIKSLPVDSSNR